MQGTQDGLERLGCYLGGHHVCRDRLSGSCVGSRARLDLATGLLQCRSQSETIALATTMRATRSAMEGAKVLSIALFPALRTC